MGAFFHAIDDNRPTFWGIFRRTAADLDVLRPVDHALRELRRTVEGREGDARVPHRDVRLGRHLRLIA